MSIYGNGGYKPVPGGEHNIWNVQNGTYGVVIPIFGSFCNSNSTPQISGTTIIKGNNYVRYENTENGHFTVVNSNGKITHGVK
jgi:hypothetical protein